MTNWINEPESIDKYEGFVYLIENLVNNRKYVGKKGFWTRQKNKKTHRKEKKESQWRDYWSSCEDLQKDVLELGQDKFRRTILYLCIYKKQMSFLEQKEQWDRNVLITDEYYNTNIGGKFFAYEKGIYEAKEPRITTKNKKWREIKAERMRGENNIAKRPDIRLKLSLKKKGEKHHQYGKPISPEHKEKLTKSLNLTISDGNKSYDSQTQFMKENHIGYRTYKRLLTEGKITITNNGIGYEKGIKNAIRHTGIGSNPKLHEWALAKKDG